MIDPIKFEINSVNLYDLNYPLYVSPIPLNSQKIVHIPGKYEYKHLEEIYTYVVEGYKTQEKIYLYDCVPCSYWFKKIYNVDYDKRLKNLRTLIYKDVNLPDVVTQLDCVLIDNPIELIDYCDNLLTQNYKKVKIMDGNAFYLFEHNGKGESLELEL